MKNASNRKNNSKKRDARRKVRYAVVGLGYISQIAVLPAFEHGQENSELVALVSGDPAKLQLLSRKYNVARTYAYDEYGDCLQRGEVDAVYIALPNSMHRAYTESAAEAGIHILCEKPTACESGCTGSALVFLHYNHGEIDRPH